MAGLPELLSFHSSIQAPGSPPAALAELEAGYGISAIAPSDE